MRDKVRVLVVATHPVQYASPVFRRLASQPALDLTVAYCSLQGAEPGVDPDFGVTVQWDVPLLEGYKWITVPNRSPWPGSGRFFRLVNPGLRRLVRGGGYDVVSVLTGYNCASFWIVFQAVKSAGIPLILGTDAVEMTSAWGGWWWKRWFKPPVVRAIYRAADVVTAPSSATRDFLRSLGVADERIVLVPYSVDNDFFAHHAAKADRAALRREMEIPDRALVVLFCAKLAPWKRPKDLLEAFARATRSQTITPLPASPCLIYAGDGVERTPLEQTAQALGVAERIRFLGFVNQSRLPGIYAAADLLVLPSEHEPFGLVVNEAMACGVPAVVSDRVCAHRDLITAGVNGMVYPIGDVDALARILRELFSAPEKLRRMGEAARERLATWSYRENVVGFVQAVETAMGLKSEQRR